MPEHVDSPDCRCWGCVQIAVECVGVCVVHAVAEQDRVAPMAVKDLNLCQVCTDRLSADLRLVAERWDEAQDALQPGSGGQSERHAQQTAAPLPINVAVSDALRIARDNVWSVAIRLVDDHDGLTLPADQTTPSLAEWLAAWQSLKIAGARDRKWTRDAYWLIAAAADQIAAKTYGLPTTVEIRDIFCRHRVLVDPQVPGKLQDCGGVLEAVERSDGFKTVRCQTDARHSIQWDTWTNMLKSFGAKKRRGARPKMRI